MGHHAPCSPTPNLPATRTTHYSDADPPPIVCSAPCALREMGVLSRKRQLCSWRYPYGGCISKACSVSLIVQLRSFSKTVARCTIMRSVIVTCGHLVYAHINSNIQSQRSITHELCYSTPSRTKHDLYILQMTKSYNVIEQLYTIDICTDRHAMQ